MVVVVDGHPYRISDGYLSVDEVADMLSVSRKYVEDAVETGKICKEMRGKDTAIPSCFVERILFGEVECVQLSQEQQGGKL